MTDQVRRFRIVNRRSTMWGVVLTLVTLHGDGSVTLQGSLHDAPLLWFAEDDVEEVGPDASSVLRLRP